VAKATPLKPASAKSLSDVNAKKSAPKQPAKNSAADAKSLKLAAERRLLVDASMLVAVQGIAQIVHGPADAT
jgi:hypothetical protein